MRKAGLAYIGSLPHCHSLGPMSPSWQQLQQIFYGIVFWNLQAMFGSGRRFLIAMNAVGDTSVEGLTRQLCPPRIWIQCVDIANCFWSTSRCFALPIV